MESQLRVATIEDLPSPGPQQVREQISARSRDLTARVREAVENFDADSAVAAIKTKAIDNLGEFKEKVERDQTMLMEVSAYLAGMPEMPGLTNNDALGQTMAEADEALKGLIDKIGMVNINMNREASNSRAMEFLCSCVFKPVEVYEKKLAKIKEFVEEVKSKLGPDNRTEFAKLGELAAKIDASIDVLQRYSSTEDRDAIQIKLSLASSDESSIGRMMGKFYQELGRQIEQAKSGWTKALEGVIGEMDGLINQVTDDTRRWILAKKFNMMRNAVGDIRKRFEDGQEEFRNLLMTMNFFVEYNPINSSEGVLKRCLTNLNATSSDIAKSGIFGRPCQKLRKRINQAIQESRRNQGFFNSFVDVGCDRPYGVALVAVGVAQLVGRELGVSARVLGKADKVVHVLAIAMPIVHGVFVIVKSCELYEGIGKVLKGNLGVVVCMMPLLVSVRDFIRNKEKDVEVGGHGILAMMAAAMVCAQGLCRSDKPISMAQVWAFVVGDVVLVSAHAVKWMIPEIGNEYHVVPLAYIVLAAVVLGAALAGKRRIATNGAKSWTKMMGFIMPLVSGVLVAVGCADTSAHSLRYVTPASSRLAG